ncbi:rCG36156 [Rattus norvegicus]|uniref:RCG36156 n=1 Tax=Rattus norvegicus TaxID=10116 RepID=A6IJH4_RAT|nr:rCG36156 [Rattus norvegicus]
MKADIVPEKSLRVPHLDQQEERVTLGWLEPLKPQSPSPVTNFLQQCLTYSNKATPPPPPPPGPIGGWGSSFKPLLALTVASFIMKFSAKVQFLGIDMKMLKFPTAYPNGSLSSMALWVCSWLLLRPSPLSLGEKPATNRVHCWFWCCCVVRIPQFWSIRISFCFNPRCGDMGLLRSS